MEDMIQKAKEHFGNLVKEQLERVEALKNAEDWIDYTQVKPIIIGVAGGDGIGPEITKHARTIMEFLLKE